MNPETAAAIRDLSDSLQSLLVSIHSGHPTRGSWRACHWGICREVSHMLESHRGVINEARCKGEGR